MPLVAPWERRYRADIGLLEVISGLSSGCRATIVQPISFTMCVDGTYRSVGPSSATLDRKNNWNSI